jgi:phosphatidylinositol alpha-1,6-mannosyltransferase
VSSPPRSILVVSPEFGIDSDGTYRPGGLALFARCIVLALAGAPGLRHLEAWGLLDSGEGLGIFERRFTNSATRVTARAFAGNRGRMAAEFALRHWRFDLVIFLHVGVGRLGVLRGFLPQSLWLVGIEVRRRLRWYEQFPLRRARPLLSISRFSSDEMQRANPSLPGAVPVHLSIEPDAPGSGHGVVTAHSPYRAASRRPAVLIVARIAASERYKGHDALIQAWPAVLERCAEAELWIAGTGDDEARLRASSTMLGDQAGQIHFLGRVSHERLLDLYATARVFAMPSLGEGFGLVFVEAMRFGLPCICSFDSSAEIVLDGETGFVVSQTSDAIAEACGQLLTNHSLADRMGEAGRRRFENRYTFPHMRARVQAAYRFPDHEQSS